MEQKTCDFHVHSCCSDGSFAPEALIGIAQAQGVGALALCDHNTVAGLNRFEAAAVGSGVLAVPGVEITAGFCGKEVHILGLFVRMEVRETLRDYLSEILVRKRQSNSALIGRLAAAGYHIDERAVADAAGEAIPNRVHVAKVLMERGYAASISEAFDAYLMDGGAFYRSAERFDAMEVLSFLTSLAVVPVLAHPLISLTVAELHAFLPAAKAAGLVAMETMYSAYSAADTETAAALAAQYQLLSSGGTDFHGANRPLVKMGTGKENMHVPFTVYRSLRDAADALVTAHELAARICPARAKRSEVYDNG